MIFKSCILLVAISTCTNGQAGSPTEQYKKRVELDPGNYMLYWKSDASSITFEAHVNTQGWLGLGISLNGSMFPSDIAMGYVGDDGSGHIFDTMATAHAPPKSDSHQDVTLIDSSRGPSGTMMKFSRPLTTGDNSDMDITSGGVHVIWSFGSRNVTSGLPIYHGTINRGSMLVTLLDPGVPVGK